MLDCNLRTFKRWVKCKLISSRLRFDEELLFSNHTGSSKELIKIMQDRVKVLS